MILALRAITLRSCTYDCTQCYIRNPISIPRADLCNEALANWEEKFPFLNLIEGPPWFPGPLVTETDQSLPEMADLDTPKPKMGADGLPEMSSAMQQSLQRICFPGSATPGLSTFSGSQHGMPSCPMPVALALPMPSSILPNSHASQGAPMQEFEVDEPAKSPCEYEKARARNIAANKLKLAEMGLDESMKEGAKGSKPPKVPKKPRSPRAPGQAANRPKRAPIAVRAEPVRSPTRLASRLASRLALRHAPQHTLTMPAVPLAD